MYDNFPIAMERYYLVEEKKKLISSKCDRFIDKVLPVLSRFIAGRPYDAVKGTQCLRFIVRQAVFLIDRDCYQVILQAIACKCI